eukprot:COSAG01_NODE_22055_length_873_cov_11.315844_1_plen_54_part_10
MVKLRRWARYELALSEDGAGYVLDGEVRAFEQHEEVISVLGAPDVPLTVRRTAH